MPASRRKPHAKRPVKYSLLTDDNKKLSYFKSHLQTSVKSISVKKKVNGQQVEVDDCVTLDIAEDDSGTSTVDDVCIAQVQEIRAEDSGGAQAYVLVRWFYTGTMLGRLSNAASRVENLSDRAFSPRELVLSDHAQVFLVAQLSDKITVRVFDEMTPDQDSIRTGEWWYRCFWPTKQKQLLTARHARLPLLQCAMGNACVKKGYIPHVEIQRYCPRHSCQRWYHTSCLVKHEFRPKIGDITEPLQLMLRGTPGFEWINYEEDGPDVKFFEQLKVCLPYIRGIVACAQNGVARGKHHGVVGNFDAVRRARSLLVEARTTDLWPSDAEIGQFSKWKLPDGKMYQCTGCGGAI